MNIIEISDELYLVDLPQKIEGFRKFISSWVLKSDSKAVVVDVGPSSTVEKLVESLNFLGIKDVEYVLLTHIHIDHAGGLGDFFQYFPNARVVVHEKGSKHIVNPEKLWKASKKVLGNIAEAYGKPKPIASDRIYNEKTIEFGSRSIEAIETPGHAPHHQCYLVGEFLFIGEAAGVHMPLKNDYYLRPATPPRFIYEVADESLKTLEKLGSKRVCFGHFGFKRDSAEIVKKARKQLKLWIDVVYDIACKRDFKEENEIIFQAKKELLERDRIFSKFYLLDDDIKKREDYFIENSLRGILDYVYRHHCEP